jgi:hypothetical protein
MKYENSSYNFATLNYKLPQQYYIGTINGISICRAANGCRCGQMHLLLVPE